MKTISRVLLTALLVMMLLPPCLFACAESGVGGNVLTWSLSEGVMTISGQGAMTNYSAGSTPPWEMRKQ